MDGPNEVVRDFDASLQKCVEPRNENIVCSYHYYYYLYHYYLVLLLLFLLFFCLLRFHYHVICKEALGVHVNALTYTPTPFSVFHPPFKEIHARPSGDPPRPSESKIAPYR